MGKKIRMCKKNVANQKIRAGRYYEYRKMASGAFNIFEAAPEEIAVISSDTFRECFVVGEPAPAEQAEYVVSKSKYDDLEIKYFSQHRHIEKLEAMLVNVDMTGDIGKRQIIVDETLGAQLQLKTDGHDYYKKRCEEWEEKFEEIRKYTRDG